MDYKNEIENFAEEIKHFLIYFDVTFLSDDKSEEMLQDALKGLKAKVNYNESVLPVILAVGGNYDSTIDRIKIKETQALIDLLKARRELQTAKKEELEKAENQKAILSIFGL